MQSFFDIYFLNDFARDRADFARNTPSDGKAHPSDGKAQTPSSGKVHPSDGKVQRNFALFNARIIARFIMGWKNWRIPRRTARSGL